MTEKTRSASKIAMKCPSFGGNQGHFLNLKRTLRTLLGGFPYTRIRERNTQKVSQVSLVSFPFEATK